MIEHYDLYVRAMADLENARRRSSEELVKTRKFAIEKFAENLLPVVDSLEKALEATADGLYMGTSSMNFKPQR